MQQLTDRANGISLRQQFPHAWFLNTDDIRVRSCCATADHCQDGDLFVAVLDEFEDGHQAVDLAVQRGARAILAERPVAAAVPVCVVEDTREALAHLSHTLAGRPTEQMRTVGVTGSHGKTITSALLASIFRAAGHATGWNHSISWGDSATIHANHLKQPLSSPQLCSRLAQMLGHGCTHSVLEVSSRSLAQRTTSSVQLDAAVLTNVHREHLDLHGSLKNYRRIKGRLFGQLKHHGVAILNADDAVSSELIPRLERPSLTFGMRNSAEVMGQVLERHPSEQTFLITAGSETVPVRSSMIGDHHVYNCLAATAVGLVMGVDLPTIARGLERCSTVPGCLERIECGQPFSVYVDAAGSPDRLAIALKTLRRTTRGRVLCVVGAPGEGPHQQRPLLGRVAEGYCDLTVLTSDSPGGEPPLRIIHDILDGFDRPERAWIRPDREGAIRWALESARPNDAVLIAGRGQQTEQRLADGIRLLDDREVARRCLYEAGAEQLREERPVILPFRRKVG